MKNYHFLTKMDKIPDIICELTIAHVIKHGKIERYKATLFIASIAKIHKKEDKI